MMDKKTESRMIDIIEDHARVCDLLSNIVFAMRTGCDFPNYVPVMNDASVSDMLTDIIRQLNDDRRRWQGLSE